MEVAKIDVIILATIKNVEFMSKVD